MTVAYEITLKDSRIERIDGADAYAQEGQLTTFFRTDPERRIIDRWSTRLASFRTSEVLAVRRLEEATALDEPFDEPLDDPASFGSLTPLRRAV